MTRTAQEQLVSYERARDFGETGRNPISAMLTFESEEDRLQRVEAETRGLIARSENEKKK